MDQFSGTAEHLDLEEWLLSTAKAAAVQRVTAGAAAAALAGSALDFDQRAAARGLLISQRAVSVLVAPAGTGKTYTMAQFAQVWTEQTGALARVDALLDDPAFFAPFAPHFHPVPGRWSLGRGNTLVPCSWQMTADQCGSPVQRCRGFFYRSRSQSRARYRTHA